jgi:hypothetical protein
MPPPGSQPSTSKDNREILTRDLIQPPPRIPPRVRINQEDGRYAPDLAYQGFAWHYHLDDTGLRKHLSARIAPTRVVNRTSSGKKSPSSRLGIYRYNVYDPGRLSLNLPGGVCIQHRWRKGMYLPLAVAYSFDIHSSYSRPWG